MRRNNSFLDTVDIFVNRAKQPKCIVGNTKTIDKIRLECEEVYKDLGIDYDGKHYKGLDFVIDDNEVFLKVI